MISSLTPTKTENRSQPEPLLLSILLILPPLTGMVLFAISAWIGYPALRSGFILSYGAVYGLYLAAYRDIRLPLASLALIGLALWLGDLFFDFSFDSRSGYKEQIFQLARGWNPMETSLPVPEPWIWTKAVNAYPLGFQSFRAFFFLLFGSLQIAKATNFILVFASFSATWSALRHWRLPKRFTWPAALVLAGNPIVFAQLWTFYNDGSLYALYLTGFSLFLHTQPGRYFDERQRPRDLTGWLVLMSFAACLLLLPGVKTTGFVLALSLYPLFIYQFRSRPLFLAVMSLAGLVLFFFVGNRPYFTEPLPELLQLSSTMGRFRGSYLPVGLGEHSLAWASILNYFIPTIPPYGFTLHGQDLYYDSSFGLYGRIFGVIWAAMIAYLGWRLYRKKLTGDNAFLLFIFAFSVLAPMTYKHLINQRYYSLPYIFPLVMLARFYLDTKRPIIPNLLIVLLLINPIWGLGQTIAINTEMTPYIVDRFEKLDAKSADYQYLQVAFNDPRTNPVYVSSFVSDRLEFKDLKCPFYIANHSTSRPGLVARFDRGRILDIEGIMIEEEEQRPKLRFDYEASPNKAKILKLDFEPVSDQETDLYDFPWRGVRFIEQYNQEARSDDYSTDYDVFSTQEILRNAGTLYLEAPYYATRTLLVLPKKLKIRGWQWREVDLPTTIDPASLVPRWLTKDQVVSSERLRSKSDSIDESGAKY